MNYKDVESINFMRLIDVNDKEYFIEFNEENEYIFHAFEKLQEVNSSIDVYNSKKEIIFIETKIIKKIYIFTNNVTYIRIL